MKASNEDIARQYFEWSNSAQLDKIQDLFDLNATYSSAVTGLYFGVDDIMQMMRQFFATHQRLNWHIDALDINTDHIIEIVFTLEATDERGHTYKRSGIERLVIDNQCIRHIEIRGS